MKGRVQTRRGVAQSGSALAWGARGRVFESLRPDHIIQRVARFYLATLFYVWSFLPLQNHRLWVESSRLPRGRTQALALTRGLFTNVDWSFSSGPEVFECLRLFSCVLRTTYRSTISLFISGRSGHPAYPVVRLGRLWDRIAVGGLDCVGHSPS